MMDISPFFIDMLVDFSDRRVFRVVKIIITSAVQVWEGVRDIKSFT